MIKAIVFDTDGMLIKSDKLFSIKFSEEYKVPYNQILPFFKKEFQPCLVGKADLRIQIKPYLKNWGWKKHVDDFLEYWFKSESNVDPEIIKLIPRIERKGIRCYLATNQEKYRTEYLKTKLNFGTLFDGIFSSADVGYKKPEREFFSVVQSKIRFDSKEIQFWDDTEENIKGALDFGLESYLYKNFEDFKSKLPILVE